jgi:RNA polymerase-interacting CarD/CdnL/TRCF family regulator
MNGQQATFSKGDWIVHARYGIGQVEGLERKVMDGENRIFLKVKAFNCMFWLPVTQLEDGHIRTVTTEYRIRKALSIIRQAPESLPVDHFQRGKLISAIFRETGLYPMARMIRDLHGRQAEARLNFLEEEALKKFRAQFLAEWAVVVKDQDQADLEEKLNEALATSMKKRREQGKSKTRQ